MCFPPQVTSAGVPGSSYSVYECFCPRFAPSISQAGCLVVRCPLACCSAQKLWIYFIACSPVPKKIISSMAPKRLPWPFFFVSEFCLLSKLTSCFLYRKMSSAFVLAELTLHNFSVFPIVFKGGHPHPQEGQTWRKMAIFLFFKKGKHRCPSPLTPGEGGSTGPGFKIQSVTGKWSEQSVTPAGMQLCFSTVSLCFRRFACRKIGFSRARRPGCSLLGGENKMYAINNHHINLPGPR